MDVELHRVLDAVGNVLEVLLPVPAAGMDIHCCGVRGLLDPQQLYL
jgi:hypothetical protein